MTLDNVAYFLAGVLIGFVAGLIVEYLQKSRGADASAAIAKVNADAAADENAIEQKTKNVLEQTPGLSGQGLADAVNEDLATPPGNDVPGLRNVAAEPAQSDPGLTTGELLDGPVEPAGKPPGPG